MQLNLKWPPHRKKTSHWFNFILFLLHELHKRTSNNPLAFDTIYKKSLCNYRVCKRRVPILTYWDLEMDTLRLHSTDPDSQHWGVVWVSLHFTTISEEIPLLKFPWHYLRKWKVWPFSQGMSNVDEDFFFFFKFSDYVMDISTRALFWIICKPIPTNSHTIANKGCYRALVGSVSV